MLPPIAPALLVAGLARTRVQNSQWNEKMYQRVISHIQSNDMLAGLTHPHASVRQGTLLLLIDYPAEVPLETLLSLLDDPNSSVRWQAAKYLCEQVKPFPLQPLLQRLSPDAVETEIILEAFGTLGSAAPLEVILPFLQDPDPQMRVTVIDTLRQPGLLERVPVDIFLSLLDDEGGMVRDTTLEALKDKDRNLAVVHSINALSDSEFQVHTTAFRIIQEVSPELVPEILAEAKALVEGGKPGRFFRALSMIFVADVIGYIGQPYPDCIECLRRLLRWPSWEVRVHAARALGKLRYNISDDTIRQLETLRHDPYSRAVRETAKDALAKIFARVVGNENA